MDTGVFDENRYFDVFVEYAKADVDDVCIKITVANRGPEAARLRLLPTLWFRNTWSWKKDAAKPLIRVDQTRGNALSAFSDELGAYRLSFEGDPELLFTENETNLKRLFGAENASPYVKDAFHEYLIDGRTDAINAGLTGTKAALHYTLEVPAEDQV